MNLGSKISDTIYNLELSPSQYLWNIQNAGGYVNISSRQIPNVYLSVVSEGSIINGKVVSKCKLIASAIPTGTNMNLQLIPVGAPTQAPSTSSSNNLPIILGVTIPIAVLLLAVGGYFLVRKVRKVKK